MISITPAQRSVLRAQAHHLHPVVSISHNGLTESVLKEIDRCLKAHELIKVKLHGIERDDRDDLLARICSTLACAPVQQIGNILVLWREKPVEAVQLKPSVRVSAKRLTKKELVDTPRRRASR